MASLQCALTFAQMDDVAVGIREDLHLDMPWPIDKSLDQQGVVGEGPARRTACARDRLDDLAGLADDDHALAAAAG